MSRNVRHFFIFPLGVGTDLVKTAALACKCTNPKNPGTKGPSLELEKLEGRVGRDLTKSKKI